MKSHAPKRGRTALEWARNHSVSRVRLNSDGLRHYSLGSLESKKVRFRCQPEFQITPLRAPCLFPKLESQAGDFIVVRANF